MSFNDIKTTPDPYMWSNSAIQI